MKIRVVISIKHITVQITSSKKSSDHGSFGGVSLRCEREGESRKMYISRTIFSLTYSHITNLRLKSKRRVHVSYNVAHSSQCCTNAYNLYLHNRRYIKSYQFVSSYMNLYIVNIFDHAKCKLVSHI